MGNHTLESDWLMWRVFQTLHDDLFEHTGETCPDTIEEARNRVYNIPRYASPYRVKARTQLRGWLKRYRFAEDVYDDDLLERLTNEKFFADQFRIGMLKPIPHRSYRVLQDARRIIKDILGPYREEEIYPFCRFSRNATVGFGFEDVYLDRKVNPDAILTGTKAELRWFSDYLKGDPLLSRVLNSTSDWTSRALCVASLKQVNVPKTAVIMRSVRPNTLIGSFRSIGLGDLLASRLKDYGIDLAHLQPVHQRLALIGSRRMHNVTADLSSASDSFTFPIMNRLLPREWLRAFNLGRTPYVEIDEKFYYSPSFMAMGIGYTFTLMTLCFTAILLSIQKLSGVKGRISVFGDDLIYPINMHPYVLGVFNDLNFKINADKTFVTEPFRESCGGDFFDKVDVRPARPEGVSEVYEGRLAISTYVYKLFNSLIRRWEEVELPRTFSLLREVLLLKGFELHHVPPHFPDTSGLKDGLWRNFSSREVDNGNLRKPFNYGILIPCIQEKASMRPVGHMDIFLWEKLQREPKLRSPFSKSFPSDVLIWRRKKKKKRKNVDVKGSSREFVAYTSRKGYVFFNLTLSSTS